MKKLLKFVTVHLFFAAIFFSLSACSTLTRDIKVDTQADPKARFDGYKSYAWLASSEIVYDPNGQWESGDIDIDTEVRTVIDTHLRKRGMTETADQPDLFVVFGAGVDTSMLGIKEDPTIKEQMLVNVPQAALLIGFIDAETGYLIWTGAAQGEAVGNRAPDETRQRIEYAVSKMFKQIP